jgi:hypothetical protein
MGTNTLLTIDMITRELIRNLENELVFSRGVNRGYDDRFAKAGAKIGDTVRIRMPNRFYAANGANFVSQDYTEANVSLQLAYRKHVGFGFTTQDKTLSLDDYSERTLKPAAIALANKLDLDALSVAAFAAYNNVGTPGTTPGAASGSGVANTAGLDVLTNAGMFLSHFSAPAGENRMSVFNPTTMAGISKTLAGMYNDKSKISQIYRDGRMRGTHLGLGVGMDQNIATVTSGTRANGTANGANQTGANLAITAAGNAATIVKGERFTIANVYSVNPVNQQSTGQLQQFVVTANATMSAGGANTITISPSMVVAAANVANGTINALAANGAALTWAGNASTVGVQNLVYDKNSFAVATADLDMPSGNVEASRANHNGLSIRVVKYYDGANDIENCRVDILYGLVAVRPEHLCVVYG